MDTRRITVRFTQGADAEVRDAIFGILELPDWGQAYRNNDADTVVVLPNPARADSLKAQLSQWEKEGALTWSELAT